MPVSFWQRPPRNEAAPRPARPVSGRLRVDRRTKALCQRLRRGDLAVIDHPDLDATAAQALAERRPAAVLNASRSITGRYPNRGPALLLDAGVPLVDDCGPGLLEAAVEGAEAELVGGELRVGGRPVARGRVMDRASLEEQLAEARTHLAAELRSFSRNTLEYLDREGDQAVTDLVLPALETRFHKRPALIVVRGEGHKRDLRAIAPYIREQRPVLVGVDGGADALLACGYRPHLIIGDMDSASEAALRCGAELVVHTYPDGRQSPGLERLERLGLPFQRLAAPGTSEDVALLLAFQSGASLLVAVGTHLSLEEFLDKRRAGMASTFLTRLKVGSLLVDAKGLSRLYRPGLSPSLVLGIFLSALLPVAVVIANSAGLQRWLGLLGMSIEVWLRRQGLR